MGVLRFIAEFVSFSLLGVTLGMLIITVMTAIG